MGFIKLTGPGEWSLRSETDPRWNKNGDCTCGGFVQPEECKEQIKILTAKYGEPPDDLEWGYMKF